jgi:hypothetical protein
VKNDICLIDISSAAERLTNVLAEAQFTDVYALRATLLQELEGLALPGQLPPADAPVSPASSQNRSDGQPDPSPSLTERQVGGTHYQMPIQHAEFCQVNRLPWCESAAIKYLVRHQRKGKVEDLRKAIHYTQLAAWYAYGVDLAKAEA